MKDQIKTSLLLPFSPQQVWAVLMDFEKYPEWNPFILRIAGQKQQGGALKVLISQPESKGMEFKPELIGFKENELFEWKGKLFIAGLFDGTHRFQLKEENGQTCFYHEEDFSGILVPFLKSVLSNTVRGFEAMNAALLSRCKALYS